MFFPSSSLEEKWSTITGRKENVYWSAVTTNTNYTAQYEKMQRNYNKTRGSFLSAPENVDCSVPLKSVSFLRD